jgi:glucose-1-phosphate cytidylyltransferase
LANYSDGLTDLPLPQMIERFKQLDKIGMLMSSKPSRTFHVASMDGDNNVQELCSLNKLFGVWINAGYFIFKKEIFDYINPGEDLAEEPMQRLIAKKQLAAYPYSGSFFTMDTFKEKQMLDDMYARGDAPWEVWKSSSSQKRVA